MPKLILRCNYLKNSPPAHLANYINYIGTREGVEKVGSTTSSLPATDRQKSLIEDILAKIPDANRMHEYHDYIQRPTRENASEFITQALENNLDIIAKKKNYMDYLANRPGVEIIGTHGLFSNEGEPVVLSRVAEEVANHPGVIWTNVISLRRVSVFWGKLLYPSFFCFSQIKSVTFSVFSCKIFKKTLDTPVFAR